MAYTTSNEYKEIIYSGDTRHQVKIWFNGIELEDADRYCEKITRKYRIIPNDGSKRFSLDNFISQEVELILHRIDTSIIEDQVEISIGTLISPSNYEYVPLGIFNIQGTPKTDKDKISIKLRDNRVRFDFGYNAKPLIDMNGGSATKKQILNDICSKANVVNDVVSFLGENDPIGIYDNTITGTTYVSYIAEQAGRIPVVTRNGHLAFIDIKNLITHKIPLFLLEKYELGNKFEIERAAYESGAFKYQTSPDVTLDTLYINSANPYILSQAHIESLFQNVNGFEIDSATTGKVLGDPAIDPWDLIEVYGYYDENNHFVDDDSVVVFRTLANHTMTYTGKITNVYSTQIGLEERKENTTISGEAAYRKYAKSEYDAVNAELSFLAGETIDGENPNSLLSKQSKLTIRVDNIESEISNVTGMVTTKDSTLGTITFTDATPESEPITIKVYPTSTNISYLYPSSGLFPSPTTYLKTRTIRFTNNSTYELTQDKKYTSYRNYYVPTRAVDEYTLLVKGTDYQVGDTITGDVYQNTEIDYILPNDLLFYDDEHYDEFYLDLNSETCQVTKRCKYNADGTTSLLDSETIIDYEYPTIQLSEGKYTVSLLGYNSGYILTTLIAKNIYTDQFYTKVETGTLIDQKIENIDLEAYEKFTDLEGNVATNSSKISVMPKEISLSVNNGSVSSGITISITKDDGTTSTISGTIQMNGLVKFTDLSTSGSTEINGDNIKTGTIKSNNYEANVSGMKIDLLNGSIDSKNFKLDTSGNITITGKVYSSQGNIGGFGLTSYSLQGYNGNIYLYADGRVSFNNDYGWINCGSSGTWLQGNSYSYPCYLLDAYSRPSTDGVTSIRLHTIYGKIVGTTTTEFGADYNYGGTSLSKSDIEFSADRGSIRLWSYYNTHIYGDEIATLEGKAGAIVYSPNTINIGTASNTIYPLSSNARYIYLGASSTSVYIKGSLYGGSSKAIKKNIKELSKEELNDIYNSYKEQKTYSFNYKKDYDLSPSRKRYGFILDEMENTKIGEIIGIEQSEADENIKTYNPEDLSRANFIMIKILLDKIEKLEEKING